MSEEKFRQGTQCKMYNKRSLEISKNGYKSTPFADDKSEERIKKKRNVTTGHVFTGSGSGKLQAGSSSGQQAMDAEPVRDKLPPWFRSARVMRLSDYPLSNLRSGSKKCKWSVVVAPGRYVTVDPGQLFLIKKISYVGEQNHIIPGAPDCRLYLGINKTRSRSVIGHLKPGSRNELDVHLPMNERFTIGHSGYSCVRFSGHRYVPQGQPEPGPPPSELRVAVPEKRSSRNPREWTLPLELTAKVFSSLSTSDIAKAAERVCLFFRAAGHDSSAYANIDLCNLRYGEDLIALMCIRRAGLRIVSLAVGFSYRHSIDFDLNRMYSGRFLEPLRYVGMGLKKLKLVGLDLIGPDDLTPVLAICSLTNLELHNMLLVPLDYAMDVASVHCEQLQCFEYTCKDIEGVLGLVSDATLQKFSTCIPHLMSMGLRGVHISDSQLLLLMCGLKNLTNLDLSDSMGFTGSFLGELLNQELELVLEVLVFRKCRDLEQDELEQFFTSLGDKPLFFSKLRNLVIIGFEAEGDLKEGFEGRIGLAALSAARPAITISTDFELKPPAEFVLAEYEQFMLDSHDPRNEREAVRNEENDEWEYRMPIEELDLEEYAILPGGVRRRMMGLIYWG